MLEFFVKQKNRYEPIWQLHRFQEENFKSEIYPDHSLEITDQFLYSTLKGVTDLGFESIESLKQQLHLEL